MKTIEHEFKIAGSNFDLDIYMKRERYQQLNEKHHNEGNYYFDLEDKLGESIEKAITNCLISPKIYGAATSLDKIYVNLPNSKKHTKLDVEVWEEGDRESYFILINDQINTN